MTSLKQGFQLYKENFRWVLLIGITIIFPIQVIFSFLTNYMAFPFEAVQVPLWPQMIQSLFMLMAVFLIHPAFISIVVQDERFDEVRIGKVYADAVQYMFPVYIIGIAYSCVVMAGLLLFIIPGLILLIGFLAIPYAAVIEDLTWWRGIKRTAAFGRAYFFKILVVLLGFALIDFILSAIAYLLAYFLTTLIVGINIAFMIVNILLLPLFIFTMAYLYLDWKRKSEVIAEKPSFSRTVKEV